jgi:hypothetical protein
MNMNDERIDRPTSDRAFVALILILVVAWTSCRSLWPDSRADAETAPPAGAARTDTVASAQAAQERVVGTVKAVDARSHTLLLMTGVGHALRVVRITLPPGLAIQSAAPGTAILESGCIVRVEFEPSVGVRAASAAHVASSVTVLRAARRGRTP